MAASSQATIPASTPTARSIERTTLLPVRWAMASVQWATLSSRTATPTPPTPTAMRRRELSAALLRRGFFAGIAGVADDAVLLVPGLPLLPETGEPFRLGVLTACMRW